MRNNYFDKLENGYLPILNIKQKMPIFKHSLILQDNEELFTHKISKIIELSIMECERVYPIFNAVMRQNVEPAQALYTSVMVM